MSNIDHLFFPVYLQILAKVQQQMMSSKVDDAICVRLSRSCVFFSDLFNFLVWKNYSSLMARKRIMTHNTLRQFKRIHMITTERREEKVQW